jgi:hypothetical protein
LLRSLLPTWLQWLLLLPLPLLRLLPILLGRLSLPR